MKRRGSEINLYTRKEPFDTLVYVDYGNDRGMALAAYSRGFSGGPRGLFVNGQMVMVKA